MVRKYILSFPFYLLSRTIFTQTLKKNQFSAEFKPGEIDLGSWKLQKVVRVSGEWVRMEIMM